MVSIEFFPKQASRTANRGPFARFRCLCLWRGLHQNPLRSNSDDSARNSPKHPSSGSLLPDHITGHVWCPLADNVNSVAPGRPTRGKSASHGRTQPQTSHPHRERCQQTTLVLLTFWDSLQQHFDGCPYAVVMCATTIRRSPRWHCAHRVIGPRVCALEEDLKSGGMASHRALLRDALVHFLRDLWVCPAL